MSQLQPIETPYRGRLFRSRLEARWAVFFDTLGVQWEYEVEGFELTKTLLYLPDFWLPSLDSYFEVKGVELTEVEERKAELLALQSGKKVYVAVGQHGLPEEDGMGDDAVQIQTFFPCGWDCGYLWCECSTCGKFGIEFEGRADRIKCGCDKDGDRGHNAATYRLVQAYHAATMARFEWEDRR